MGPQGVPGPVGITFQGIYSSTTNYALADGVSYQRLGLRVAHRQQPWQYAGPEPAAVGAVCGRRRDRRDRARPGNVGATGPAGPMGPQGPPGATGRNRSNRPAGSAGGELSGQLPVVGELRAERCRQLAGFHLRFADCGKSRQYAVAEPTQWTVLAAQGAIGATGPPGPAGLAPPVPQAQRARRPARAARHVPRRLADRHAYALGDAVGLRRLQLHCLAVKRRPRAGYRARRTGRCSRPPDRPGPRAPAGAAGTQGPTGLCRGCRRSRTAGASRPRRARRARKAPRARPAHKGLREPPVPREQPGQREYRERMAPTDATELPGRRA